MTYHKPNSIHAGHPNQPESTDFERDNRNLVHTGILVYKNPQTKRCYEINKNGTIIVQKQKLLCSEAPLKIDNPKHYSVTALHLGSLSPVIAYSLKSNDNESTITIKSLPRSTYLVTKQSGWFSWFFGSTTKIEKKEVTPRSYSCTISDGIVIKIIQISHTNFLCLMENGTLYKMCFGQNATLTPTKINTKGMDEDLFIDAAYDKTQNAVALLKENGSVLAVKRETLIKHASLGQSGYFIDSMNEQLPTSYKDDFHPNPDNKSTLRPAGVMHGGMDKNDIFEIKKRPFHWDKNRSYNNQQLSYSNGTIDIWTKMHIPIEHRHTMGYVIQQHPLAVQKE